MVMRQPAALRALVARRGALEAAPEPKGAFREVQLKGRAGPFDPPQGRGDVCDLRIHRALAVLLKAKTRRSVLCSRLIDSTARIL